MKKIKVMIGTDHVGKEFANNLRGKFNNVDETIAGTTKKITKGFVTPPVKYIKTDNCITS